jgi:hypothetical protein
MDCGPAHRMLYAEAGFMAGFAAGALRGKIGCNRPPAAASHPPELTDRLKGYNSHKRVCCRFCVAAVIVPEAQTRPVPQSSLRGRLDGDGYPFAVAFLRNLRNMRRKRIIPGPALSPQWLSLRFSIRPQMLVHPSIPVLECRTRGWRDDLRQAECFGGLRPGTRVVRVRLQCGRC